ncbi:leukocyte surface antigen CD53-like [Convolutriloba macropyga]|uniref:leukocyte surface antigen CD53-like n=1 Tax=Convolutriloba macropyga TaxID=536237 RepID=UPI003F523DB6
MDCLLGITKFLFFIFTLALWVIGVAAVGVSIYFLVTYDYLVDTADSYSLSYVSIVVIVFAALLAVMGFLGCCGTWKGSKCLLYLFAIFLSIILLGEIALGIYCLVERPEISDTVNKGLNETAAQYLTDESTIKAWDQMQKGLKCCGINDGPSDWFSIIPQNNADNPTFPESCCSKGGCKANVSDCPGSDNVKDPAKCATANVSLAYDEGCGSKVVNSLKDNLALVAAGGLVFAFLELLGVFAAVQIGGSYKKEANQYA